MWGYYVYIHRKASDGTPFYVGKGKGRRAYERTSRNIRWHRTVAKHGLIVEIAMSCQSDVEAQRQEIAMIAAIGRSDLGTGPLLNRTNGGDGHAGILVSDEVRAKRSANAKRPRSEAWVKSIRASRKNGGNGGVVKHGDKLPETWVANLAAAKVGAQNPYFGKPSPPSKKVRNAVTGKVYDSIARAAVAEGINPKTLYQYLGGTRPNRSTLVRA